MNYLFRYLTLLFINRMSLTKQKNQFKWLDWIHNKSKTNQSHVIFFHRRTTTFWNN
jgi:hypothetical protein